jgi:hypothetical protein
MTLVPQESLDWLVALLRDGRAYYRHAVVHTEDVEVRTAFGLAAEARDALIVDLREAGFVDSTDVGAPVPAPHRYEDLRRQFDPRHPALQAEALVPREEATLRLVESVFRSHPAIQVRSLMKKHYPRLQQSGAIMHRLSMRAHAA